MSDMSTAEGQGVEERKSILTVGNAWLVFSAVLGAVGILSVFAPNLPADDWSATLVNVLASYRATIREPLREALAALGLWVPEGLADVGVFVAVFWVPTFATVVVASCRDKEVRRTMFVTLRALVILFVIMAAWNELTDDKPSTMVRALSNPDNLLFLAAIFFGLIVFVLVPFAPFAAMDMNPESPKLQKLAVAAYGKVAFVLILLGAAMVANHALLRLNY